MPTVKIEKCLNCSSKSHDVRHDWFFDGLTLRELRSIKKTTGMGQAEFAAAGDEGDPEALAALLWVLHARDKIKVPFDDIDLDFKDFDMSLTEQEQKDLDRMEAEAKLAESQGSIPKGPKNGTKAKAGSKPK